MVCSNVTVYVGNCMGKCIALKGQPFRPIILLPATIMIMYSLLHV